VDSSGPSVSREVAPLTLERREENTPPGKARALVFEDAASRALLHRIERVAPSEVTVLIVGETGTGKEIVARHLHELSRRASRPFVAVNCGALTQTLVESELFGHDRGAFTGATVAKDGWFEAADGGTLFLDEIGDLPLATQVKLLRVLQEREIVRLGSRQPTAIDVRVVAATNVNLREAVAAGRFREDLYYRLNVAQVRLPALRERPADVLPLAEHFLKQHCGRMGIELASLTDEASRALRSYPWPGNIRELENVVHHALLVCHGGQIAVSDLNLVSHQPAPSASSAGGADLAGLERALTELYDRDVPDLHARVEELLVRSAYEHCHGNQVQAAQLLGISRNIFRARLCRYGLLKGRQRSPEPVVALDADQVPELE
jgi:sigma-54 dependent transcriptional regulator